MRAALLLAAALGAAFTAAAPAPIPGPDTESTSSSSKSKTTKTTTTRKSATTSSTATDPTSTSAISTDSAANEQASTTTVTQSPVPINSTITSATDSVVTSAPAPAVEVATHTVIAYVTVPGGGPNIAGIQNGATIYFPTSSVYFVYNALAMIQWAPALGVPVTIRIHNENESLLKNTYTLAKDVPPSFTSVGVSVADPCIPGTGYYLTIEDSANSTVYAQSQLFELKKQGATPIMPPGIETQTAAMGMQGNLQQGGAQAGAAVRGWACTLAVAVAGVVVGAVL